MMPGTVLTESTFQPFPPILEGLEYLQEDQSQEKNIK